MVQVVAVSDWVYWPNEGFYSGEVDRQVVGPSGVQAGDIAVLITVQHAPYGQALKPLEPGWMACGQLDYLVHATPEWSGGWIDAQGSYFWHSFGGARYIMVAAFWRPVTATPTATIRWQRSWQGYYSAEQTAKEVAPRKAAIALVRGSSGVGVTSLSAQVPTAGASLTVAIAGQNRMWSAIQSPGFGRDAALSLDLTLEASGAEAVTDIGWMYGGDPIPTRLYATSYTHPALLRLFGDQATNGVSGPESLSVPGLTFDPSEQSPIQAMTIELLPEVDPRPPTLLAPPSRTAAGDVVYRWRHNAIAAGGAASRSRLRRSLNGVVQWWTGSAWSTAQAEFTHDPGVLVQVVAPTPVGEGEWSVWTREDIDGRWSPESSRLTLVSVTPPTATITSVGDGGVSPMIVWTSSQPQTAYRLVVLDPSGIALWDSGEVSTFETQRQVPVLSWTNGATHQVRVEVASQGIWSPAVTMPLPVSWVVPDAPTVATSPHAEGVLVEVAGAAGNIAMVQRWDGRGWLPVTSGTLPLSLVDHLAPYGVDVVHRARIATNALITSDWAYSESARSMVLCDWLVSAADPSVAMPAKMHSEEPHEYPRDTSVRTGTGDTRPMVTHGPMLTRRGGMTLNLDDVGRAHEVMDQLSGPCYLRLPADGDGGTRTPGEVILIEWVGGTAVERIVQSPANMRRMPIQWVELAPLTYVSDAPPPGWDA